MLNVQVVLFDGFDLLDAIAPYEIFCAAAMQAEHALSVQFVTAEGPRSVPSGINGLKIEASARLNPDQAGIILVPGAAGDVTGDGPDSIPAILGRTLNTDLPGMIERAMQQRDTIVATVCGGSVLLAMAGLLEGRPAVTNHLGMDLLGATGAIPVPARVVDAGNLVTGGGVTSGLDVALYLVERELGPRISHAVEQLFEFERRGTVWREAGMAPDHRKVTAGEEPNINADKEPMTDRNRDNSPLQAPLFDGDWDTTIATPVGKLQIKLSITTQNGTIQGKAIQGKEIVEFLNPALEGDKLTWMLPITKPMRLNLKFEVSAHGDEMTGTAKAGMLPSSKLTGNRIS
ncbi:DJ-1/PfpI family protein [Paenibacillus chitinolyticus]|uniref:DJ-1/PfpI family protein n=1 Tax=Paenibacillus chitinolyticus TaxID=79263 RepID=UPI00363E9D8B